MAKSFKSPLKGPMARLAGKEVLAGDRLPYAGLHDENVVRLRDGSVMLSLMVPGFAFETADSDELNAHVATREVLLRSALDARFVLYHHVIRRRVEIEMDGQFDDPLAAHIDARWRSRTSSGALFVNDQFVTLVRRPARGRADPGAPAWLPAAVGSQAFGARSIQAFGRTKGSARQLAEHVLTGQCRHFVAHQSRRTIDEAERAAETATSPAVAPSTCQAALLGRPGMHVSA